MPMHDLTLLRDLAQQRAHAIEIDEQRDAILAEHLRENPWLDNDDLAIDLRVIRGTRRIKLVVVARKTISDQMVTSIMDLARVCDETDIDITNRSVF